MDNHSENLILQKSFTHWDYTGLEYLQRKTVNGLMKLKLKKNSIRQHVVTKNSCEGQNSNFISNDLFRNIAIVWMNYHFDYFKNMSVKCFTL